jgi:hypothetical protein
MLFVVNLRNRFNNFKFDLERVDIMEAVLKLQKLKTLLSTIDKKIKDKDIKYKLLSRLLTTDYWYQVKVTTIKSDPNL